MKCYDKKEIVLISNNVQTKWKNIEKLLFENYIMTQSRILRENEVMFFDKLMTIRV